MATCIFHKIELVPYFSDGNFLCAECIENAAIKSFENLGIYKKED